MCTHEWKLYEGLTESFKYCILCGVKLSECPSELSATLKALYNDDFLKRCVYSKNPFLPLLDDSKWSYSPYQW